MASLAMHWIISDLYLAKHREDNYDEFLSGAMAPDITGDKMATHCSYFNKNDMYVDRLHKKVDIIKFCNTHSINTSFERGYFLHILTDYIFYNSYMANIESLQNLVDAREDVYNDYRILNGYLVKKYGIDMSVLPECGRDRRLGKYKYITNESIDNIIQYCSSIDIINAYDRLKMGDVSVIDKKFEN